MSAPPVVEFQRVVQRPIGKVVIMPRASFADVTSCNGESMSTTPDTACDTIRLRARSRLGVLSRWTLAVMASTCIGLGRMAYWVGGGHMRSTKFALSAGAAVAVVAALNIPLAPSSDLIAANQAGAALNCNLTEYKASTGLTSALEGNVLTVAWNGQGTSQLRARFAIDGGTPTIRDLSVRRGSGEWAMLGQNLTPEYQVTTGRRRMSNDQANAFASLGIDVTPEVLEKHKWYAFWDAPLSVPGYSPAREGGGGRGGAGAQGPATSAWTGRHHSRTGRSPAIGLARQTRFQPEPQPSRLHRRPRHSAAADEGRNPARRVCVLGLILRGQERRCEPRGDFPGNEARHLRRQPAVHRVSRDEPHSDGRHCAHERAFGRLQVRRGPEGILDSDDAPGDLARHRRASATASVRRAKGDRPFGDTRVQPSAAGRRSAWLGGHVPAAAHVLLHARGGREPRVRLLSQRRRRHVQHRRHDAGGRIRYVPAIRAELRVVQRPPGHVAEDVDVLLREPGARRSDAAGGARVHARRRLQGGPRLQDVRQSLPSSGRRPDACRRVRHAASGPDGDEGDRPQRDRLERFPCR